jgi:hypothetical protein
MAKHNILTKLAPDHNANEFPEDSLTPEEKVRNGCMVSSETPKYYSSYGISLSAFGKT